MNLTAVATHKFPFAAKATQQHNNDGGKDGDEDEDRNKRDSNSTVVVRLTFRVLRNGGWGLMGGY